MCLLNKWEEGSEAYWKNQKRNKNQKNKIHFLADKIAYYRIKTSYPIIELLHYHRWTKQLIQKVCPLSSKIPKDWSLLYNPHNNNTEKMIMRIMMKGSITLMKMGFWWMQTETTSMMKMERHWDWIRRISQSSWDNRMPEYFYYYHYSYSFLQSDELFNIPFKLHPLIIYFICFNIR